MRRGGSDDGTAVIEFLVVAVLLLVPVLAAALTIVGVEAAALASTQAVRQAGRAFMIADDESSGRRSAQLASEVALNDQGFSAPAGALTITCAGRCLAPSTHVQVRLAWDVDLPWMPGFLRDWLPSVPITAQQSFSVDTYRSGLET